MTSDNRYFKLKLESCPDPVGIDNRKFRKIAKSFPLSFEMVDEGKTLLTFDKAMEYIRGEYKKWIEENMK